MASRRRREPVVHLLEAGGRTVAELARPEGWVVGDEDRDEFEDLARAFSASTWRVVDQAGAELAAGEVGPRTARLLKLAAAFEDLRPLLQLDSGAAMTALALRFPTLQDAAGVTPWDPARLDAWACGPAPGSGALRAARFVLGVWSPGTEWDCGRFDALDAMSSWDEKHRAAFVSWVVASWWP